METLKILFVIAVLAAVVFFILYQYEGIKKRILRNSICEFNQQYLTKHGGTTMPDGTWLNYFIKSFDGGTNWYAVDLLDYNKFKEIKILGKANDVYPNLLEHLKAWNKLTKHVSELSYIDEPAITTTEIDLLEKCGFKIAKATDTGNKIAESKKEIFELDSEKTAAEISTEKQEQPQPTTKQAEMEQFFNGIMQGLEEATTPDFPNSVFYRKNGNSYIEHDKKNGYAWLSYILIWSVFYNRFGLNYDETQQFTQGMLGTHPKLGGLTTRSGCSYSRHIGWEHIQNWGD